MDARYPERWLTDRRVLQLGDEAYRLFVTGLAWSVANRTDGVLTDAELGLLPRVDKQFAWELENAGLWLRDRDGSQWLIVDYAATQSSKDELDQLDRVRLGWKTQKRKQRAASEGQSTGSSSGQSGGPSTRTSVGKAKARQGKGALEEGDGSQRNGPRSEAPVEQCVECGVTWMLRVGRDGVKRCPRHHFDRVGVSV